MQNRSLGFSSFEEYFKHFLETLLPTNKTYSYFVDWNKVYKNVKKYKNEIFLLNSLRNESKKTITSAFVKLSLRYSDVISVLPILIAERINNGHISIYDDELDEFFNLNFKSDHYSKESLYKIARFCEKTGIFDLILKVKDLYDYLIGVEVGIDTNSRKNRSGKIFEKMIEKMLAIKIKESRKYKIIPQDKKISLYTTKKGKRINRHDFVVYNSSFQPIAVIEVNFYNVQGSKPDSIVGNYISLHQEAKKKGILFIWITDGVAWIKMKHYLRKAMEEIDWVLNYKIAKEKILSILQG